MIREGTAWHSLEAEEILSGQDIDKTCAWAVAQAWYFHRPSGPFGDKDRVSGEFSGVIRSE